MSTATLVYETEDSNFADSCINALQEGGIDCYRTGGSVMGGSTPMVCIYVRNAEDMTKANAILISIGAVVDASLKLPSRGILIFITLVVAILIVTAATNFNGHHS